MSKKFDVTKFEKLNNSARLKLLKPEILWEIIGRQGFDVFADIGAGTGFFSKEFFRLSEDKKFYCLDISNDMINWMNNNIKPQYLDKLIPVKMDEATIPLEDESIDSAFAITVHHELDNPVELLKDCRRILRNGGQVTIVDWKKEEFHQGPPMDIRVDNVRIEDDLSQAGFVDLKSHTVLDHFSVVTASKG